MSDYTKLVDFATKDSLPTGDSDKIIKGTEIETEYDNIAVAIATKSNIASPTFTGIVTLPDLTLNAANPEILGGDTDGVLYIAPSTTNALGGNVLLYGDTHATKANDVEVRATAGVELHYDDSASTWDFQANNITTTGTLGVTGVTTVGGDILSDTDSTDSLGSTGVRWLKVWTDTLTAGTLTIGAGSIVDSSGAISFGDDNLVTTGTLDSGALTATSLSLTTNLAVADGGTGASTLTNGGVLLGSGTGAITAMAVLADGEMIVGDGTTNPVAESGATLRSSIGVDAAGTDNSTNVTLAGTGTYLSLAGQEITVDPITESDISDLGPYNNYSHPNHTGDVTSTGDGATVIANDAVTYAKMQNVVANNVILGNNAGAGGVVDELTAAEVLTIINVEAGADVTDAVNVAAAGAVMESDSTTALMSFVIDEDSMVSDSATKVPTQQSVKAYVDASSAGGALADLTDTTITSIAANEVLKWNGSAWINNTLAEAGIDPAGTDNSTNVTLAGTGTYLSLAGQQITVDPITESDIANDAVTYAKMQNVSANNRLLGTNSGAGSVVEELAATPIRNMLNVEDGADVTDTTNVVAALSGATLTGALVGGDQTVSRVNLKDYGEVTNAIGSTGGGTQDIDLTLGNSVSATVDTSANTFTFSNPTASDELCGFTLYLVNGGSQTVTWPASVDWPGGTAPTLTASGTDKLVFETIDGGTTWLGNLVGAAYA